MRSASSLSRFLRRLSLLPSFRASRHHMNAGGTQKTQRTKARSVKSGCRLVFVQIVEAVSELLVPLFGERRGDSERLEGVVLDEVPFP